MTPPAVKMDTDRDFSADVYAVVRLVPKGRVTTYGAIAAYLGAKRSSRLVGWVMNRAHDQVEPVPAHRVVNRMGVLSGKHHFPEHSPMEVLLKQEGIAVVNDQVVDFDTIFWDPIKELEF